MADRNDWNRKMIDEFRANGGKVGGMWEGRPLLLLTTTGARSSQRHTTPAMYLRDSDRLLIFATKGGAPSHPDWYHNLVAHPEVTVEVGTETYETTAIVTQGAERQQLWTWIIEQYSFFADHQTKTTRQIPVIALSRRESQSPP